MKTNEELKQIAKDYYAGKIFSDQNLKNPNDLRSVFMAIGLMGKDQLTKFHKKASSGEIAFLYEYMNNAAPRSVNGMPGFFSFRTLSQVEFDKMHGYWKDIKEKMDSV